MVAICAKSYFWEAIQREKRISRAGCLFAAEDESFEVPATFWVIKLRGEEKFVTETGPFGTFLLAFITQQKAIDFLQSRDIPVSDYTFPNLQFSEAKERVREKPCIVGVIVYGGKKPFPLPFHCPHL